MHTNAGHDKTQTGHDTWGICALQGDGYVFTNHSPYPAEDMTIEDNKQNPTITIGRVDNTPGTNSLVVSLPPGRYLLAWQPAPGDGQPTPHRRTLTFALPLTKRGTPR